MSDSKYEKLNTIHDNILSLKYDIQYKGYDPDRPTTEEAIAKLCDALIEIIEIQLGR